MPLEARLIDPRREPIPVAWNGFVADAGLSPLWRSELLSAQAWYERYRPVLVVVEDRSGRPAALFCARHVSLRRSRASFHSPGQRPLIGFAEFHLPPGITLPGHAFHPALDTADRLGALEAAERAVGGLLGRSCSGFAYRQVSAADVATFQRRCRFVRPASPETVVENEWASFDDYLASLGPDDRRDFQRIRRLVDRDPTVMASVEHRLVGGEASRLAYAVRLKHRERFHLAVPAPAAFFDALGQVGGARFLTYRDTSGGLLAYGLLLDDGTALRSYSWGTRDRADGGRQNLYFDHFLREVEYCVAHGRSRLAMGKSMAHIKERFGGRPARLYTAATLR
jgi:hypothetical protein